MESTASHVLKEGLDQTAVNPVLNTVEMGVTQKMDHVNVSLQICHKLFYLIW